jgi:hypothetical protein
MNIDMGRATCFVPSSSQGTPSARPVPKTRSLDTLSRMSLQSGQNISAGPVAFSPQMKKTLYKTKVYFRTVNPAPQRV